MEPEKKILLRSIADRSPRMKLMNFKVTAWEFEHIKKRADKFADGNISAFIREACVKYIPSKNDLVEVDGGN